MNTHIIDSGQETAAARYSGWGDILGAWRICRKRACQRSRHCCGETADCLRNNLPVLPDGVQLWFVTLIDCRTAGLAFEDAMAKLDGSCEEESFIAWREMIGRPVTVLDESALPPEFAAEQA
jgi:hypothetical protein